jgi:hypothetical protein
VNLRLAGAILGTILVPEGLASAGASLELAHAPRSPQELAAQYAPYLILDSAEAFVPLSRGSYVVHTSLRALRGRFRHHRKLILAKPQLKTLPKDPLCDPEKRDCYYSLAVQGHNIRNGAFSYVDVQTEILAYGGRPVVYWNYKSEDRTLQYWFFYVFNDFQNVHEADWEQITLQLDGDHPSRVGFSSHNGGQRIDWSALDDRRGRVDDHVLVFVAKGSHANYFQPGTHPVHDCAYLCKDRSDGCGLKLPPTDYVLRELEPNEFSGDYSSGNFIAKGPKGPKFKLNFKPNVSDPRTRPTFTKPLGWLNGARLTKPYAKESWRCADGSTPGERRP